MVGVSKTYPPQKQVLKNIYLSFFYGAKIGIIGLNGSGKSSLLKIIAGLDKSYQGEVVFSPGYSVGYLEQEPQLDDSKTVKEIVQEGVQPIMDILKEYEDVNNKFAEPEYLDDPDKMDKLMNRQAELIDQIEAAGAWDIDSKLERAMDALRTPDGDEPIKNLSGGERRRVALCRLLLQQPDILLLDERHFTGNGPAEYGAQGNADNDIKSSAFAKGSHTRKPDQGQGNKKYDQGPDAHLHRSQVFFTKTQKRFKKVLHISSFEAKTA